MIERPIHFDRYRHARCSACGVLTAMSPEEFELWCEHLGGDNNCSLCGAVAEPSETAAAPDDLALAADMVEQLAWYHTSTHPDWPSGAWEPTAGWALEAFHRMERMLGPGAVERWRADQLRKCLHLGTYEAAIENAERRRRNQADRDSLFYLYRVRLTAGSVVLPEIIKDPGGLVGDVLPEDVMSDEDSIVRYVNAHEDVGSISLAVRRSAIAEVQGIPLTVPNSVAWWGDHLAELDATEWREV